MKTVFIAWAPHSRRSESLSKELNADLYLMHWKFRKKLYAPFKYPLLSLKTWIILTKEKPSVVFVQSPPFICSLVCLIYARLFGSKIIIDAHTGAWSGIWRYFFPLNKWVMRNSELTIVTNEELKRELNNLGIESFVLEDKLPELSKGKKTELKKGFNIVVVNTFASDEPVGEILKAARESLDVNFYFTGNLAYAKRESLKNKPRNVVFTGFLSEDEFIGSLRASNAIMVLTTRNYTLLSGCYEAVSIEKPIITSDWPVLMSYFSKGCVYVDNSSSGIAEGVRRMLKNHEKLEREIKMLKIELNKEWNEKLEKLLEIIKP
jgi:glycosyltransferase involved in cell wall biosynthesis